LTAAYFIPKNPRKKCTYGLPEYQVAYWLNVKKTNWQLNQSTPLTRPSSHTLWTKLLHSRFPHLQKGRTHGSRLKF